MQIRSDEGGWVRAGLAVLVAGVLGGGAFAAASGQDSPRRVTADGVAAKSPVAAPPAPRDEAPKKSPVVGDTVAMGADGGSVTVSAVEDDVSAGRLFGAEKGSQYIAAEVKGCSGPHEQGLSFAPGYFLLRLDDGTMHDHGPGVKKPSLDGGTVPAGRCLSGWVTFTVPTGALPVGVVYDGSSRMIWTVPLPKGAHPTTSTTLKPGATTSSTATAKGGSATTTTTKPKTAAGAGSPSTTTTAKPSATTSTTAKPAGTTTTTAKPPTTSTTGGGSTTTSTTAKPGPTTTTTGAVATPPTTPSR